MHSRKLLFIVAAASAPAFAALPGVDSELPELTLQSGRVLTHVRFVSFSPSTTMAKWDGGRGTIPYDEIPEPVRSRLESLRAAGAVTTARPRSPETPKQASAKTVPPEPARPASITVTGQAFVTTQGAGAYKFAGMAIHFYRAADADAARGSLDANLPTSYRLMEGTTRTAALFAAWSKSLEPFTATASTTTDADGNFAVQLPSDGAFVAFAANERYIGQKYLGRGLGSAAIREAYLWIVPVGGARLDLTGSNCLPE